MEGETSDRQDPNDDDDEAEQQKLYPVFKVIMVHSTLYSTVLYSKSLGEKFQQFYQD